MKKMKKQVVNRWNRNYYLLGIRKEDSKKVWLEDFSWDCGWYWGGGYVEIFTSNNPAIARDLQEHTHFYILFLENPIANFKNYFKATTLNDSEIWRLHDLFKQFYALKECAEIFQYSHLSQERTKEEINKKLAKKINEHIEKVIIPLIRELLVK